MRYIDLEGHPRKFNGVGGYAHKSKGFCENLTFPKSIYRGRMTIIKVFI